MCGEHSWSAMMAPFSMGSSPHVRGAQPIRDVFADIHGIIPALRGAPPWCHPRRPSAGIIPACAGSTSSRSNPVSESRDHPRMCGEHVLGSRKPEAHEGSSPHVRGARSTSFGATAPRGIIPACAGSTEGFRLGACCGRDHPRMCGEH